MPSPFKKAIGLKFGLVDPPASNNVSSKGGEEQWTKFCFNMGVNLLTHGFNLLSHGVFPFEENLKATE